MTAPELSLCIATLNRANLLAQTLESIIAQANDEVEVVIVDGGSADHTSVVVSDMRQKFANIKYLRLDEKGGVDQDFARAVALAEGKYCWLFSDDDVLKTGAIQAVLQAIEQRYSLIIVNSEVRGPSLESLIEERRLKIFNNIEYTQSELDRLFSDTASYLSFIGAVVIKKDLWEARRISDYFGTEFVHVGVIFQDPIPGTTIVLANPYISIRYGNAQWSPRAIDIWMLKWPNLIWSFPGISDHAKRSAGKGKSIFWQRLQTSLLFRAQGIYDDQEYKKRIQSKLGSNHQRILMKLTANLPRYLINPIAVAYFKWFSPSSGISLYDLRKSRYYLGNIFDRSSKTHDPA